MSEGTSNKKSLYMRYELTFVIVRKCVSEFSIEYQIRLADASGDVSKIDNIHGPTHM
jgi:hypothetical protein